MNKLFEIVETINNLDEVVVLLFGEHGTGKDTYAKLLSNVCKIPKYSFSDPLYIQLEVATGISKPVLDMAKRTNKLKFTEMKVGDVNITGLTVREALIKVSTETRKSNDYFYANYVASKVNTHNKLIIPDLRFDVEMEVLKGKNLLTIGIDQESNQFFNGFNFTLDKI